MQELEQVLLLRHGQTDHNLERRFCGRTDVPLNPQGEREAAALAERLRGTRLDAIIASPLARARATAEAVAGAVGGTVAFDDRLMELDHGELEGQPFAEIMRSHPELLGQFLEGPEDVTLPGGESLGEVRERAAAVLAEVLADPPGARVALVAHQMVIVALVCHVLDIPLAAWARLRTDRASITILERAHGMWNLRRLNDAAHLRPLGEEYGP